MAYIVTQMIELEGGCRVTGMRDGEPEISGNRRIWRHFESRLSLRVIELHGEATFANAEHDEVLYDLAQNTGVYIPAGVPLTLGCAVTRLRGNAAQRTAKPRNPYRDRSLPPR